MPTATLSRHVIFGAAGSGGRSEAGWSGTISGVEGTGTAAGSSSITATGAPKATDDPPPSSAASGTSAATSASRPSQAQRAPTAGRRRRGRPRTDAAHAGQQ